MKDDSVRVHLDVDPESASRMDAETGEPNIKILLIADFRLRGFRGGASPERASLDPVAVDAGNYEEILSRWTPRLTLPDGESWHALSMDDFHPDSLAELLSDGPAVPLDVPEPSAGASLLEQMLGAPLPKASAAAPADAIDQAIRRIASEHAVPAEPAHSKAMRVQSRATRVAAMLQCPELAAAEANWRAVRFLLERLPEDVQLYLADITCEAWTAALLEHQDLSRCALAHAVHSGEFGDEPFAVVACAFDFTPDAPSMIAASRAARVAAASGCRLILGASHGLVGMALSADGSRLREAWNVLRASAEAANLGLAYPRVALRPGYGAGALMADVFEDAEVETPCLWSNAAVACLAAFASGREALTGFPVVAGRPPLETALTESEASSILDCGIMPLVWWKGTDRIQVLRFQFLKA